MSSRAAVLSAVFRGFLRGFSWLNPAIECRFLQVEITIHANAMTIAPRLLELSVLGFGLAATYLSAWKAKRPYLGQGFWGVDPFTVKYSIVEDHVHGAGRLMALAAGTATAARLLVGGAPDGQPWKTDEVFVTLGIWVVLVVALSRGTLAFALGRAGGSWRPQAHAHVREALGRLEIFAAKGVWPEHVADFAAADVKEQERIRQMDGEQAMRDLNVNETLLELDHAGTVESRVRRLRATVG